VSNAPTNQSGAMYDRALAYYQAGDYARCRDCTQQALAADPRNVPSLVLQGMVLVEFGQPEEAVESLRQAIGVAPDSAEAWRQLGVALLIVGGRTEALQAFEKALVLGPRDVSVLIDVGNLLFMSGKPQEAIDTLEQARRLVPGDVTVLRNVADMYASLQRHEDVLSATREILQSRPDDVLACCDAASLCLQLDRLDEAADMFRLLRRIDPVQEHEIVAIHGLVMTEMRRRDWRRAFELISEATRVDRYDLTTGLLIYISNNLFGASTAAEIPLSELVARFDTEQDEHRRLHAEVPT
jgi:tetratricopeptide (TPR) repeat protein